MRYLLTHKVFSLGLLSFLVVLVGALLWVTPAKAAGSCSGTVIESGRVPFCGYFDNQYNDEGDFVLSDGLYDSTNANTFIAQIKSYLSGSYGEQDKTGAEFIIDTMIGLSGGASRNVGSTTCSSTSTNAYCVWQDSVEGYANGTLGSVNWRQSITVSGNQCNGSASANINTYWQPAQDDDAYFRDNDCTAHGVPSITTNFIVFKNTNGSTAYILRIECGNPYGTLNGLKHNTPPTGTITASSCTTVSLKVWDPDNPSSKINYYLSVNGGTQQGPFQFNGSGAAAVTRTVSSYPGFDYWKANNVVLSAVDVNDGLEYTVTNVSLPICGKITCTGSMTTLSGDLVAGEQTSFQVWVQVTGAPAGPPGADFTSVQMTNPQNQTTTIASGVSYTGASTLYSPSLTYTPETSGNYTLKWVFGGGESNPASVTCAPPAGTPTAQAALEPYFTVLGGDVAAGPGFGSGCTESSSSILGENLGSGGGYFGASAREGALATSGLSQFATVTTNATTNNLGGSTAGLAGTQPSALAFANTSPPAGDYGGNFMQGASAQWCVQDYTTGESTATQISSMSQVATGTNNYEEPGTYSYVINGDQTIGGLTLSPGVRINLYVKGNVYINGNILYGNYGGNPLGESSGNMAANIPQFNLVSDGGNIYIYSAAPGVTPTAVEELHGSYIAQPTSAGANGDIYTCATGIGASTDAYNTCNEPLTFYGAVAAKQILLDRTRGNVAKTTSPTDPNYSAQQSDYPAEQFVFTPEEWLGGTSTPSTTCDANPLQPSCLYQSYTSLPPVL
ncbi:MAG TPA: hypothetical protein VMB52_01290 [Verrucomicrobiae bacterium]|nr:hypothetical protein [Verrucomicrobiae bacterium]